MFSKLVRIGRDAELKQTPTGTSVLEINAVYDVGFGDKKEGQWIRLAMFGNRAEKLFSHFKKGTQILIHADDIKARAYTKGDGQPGCSLEGKLVEFQFAGGGQQQGQATQNVASEYPKQIQHSAQNNDLGPADFDEIPFAPLGLSNRNLMNCI